MTGHASPGDLFRPRPFEREDLALVPSALDVRRARSMARFATMRLVAPDLGEASLEMRACIHALELLFVASLACFRADELRRVHTVAVGRVACCHLAFCHGVRAAALHCGQQEQCDHPGCDSARKAVRRVCFQW